MISPKIYSTHYYTYLGQTKSHKHNLTWSRRERSTGYNIVFRLWPWLHQVIMRWEEFVSLMVTTRPPTVWWTRNWGWFFSRIRSSECWSGRLPVTTTPGSSTSRTSPQSATQWAFLCLDLQQIWTVLRDQRHQRRSVPEVWQLRWRLEFWDQAETWTSWCPTYWLPWQSIIPVAMAGLL